MRYLKEFLAIMVILVGFAALTRATMIDTPAPKPVWTWRCLAKPEEVTDALNMLYPESARDAKISTQTYSRGEGFVGTIWCIWYHQ
jgi:hypothetical protein